jgi:hypothetical protein
MGTSLAGVTCCLVAFSVPRAGVRATTGAGGSQDGAGGGRRLVLEGAGVCAA